MQRNVDESTTQRDVNEIVQQQINTVQFQSENTDIRDNSDIEIKFIECKAKIWLSKMCFVILLILVFGLIARLFLFNDAYIEILKYYKNIPHIEVLIFYCLINFSIVLGIIIIAIGMLKVSDLHKNIKNNKSNSEEE